MLRRAAGLPDPLVGLLPDARRALGLRLHDRPEAGRQALGLPRVEQDRVEHGAEDVVLALVVRAVADPHRLRARVAGEVVERRLGQLPPAVDPVHDLQRAVVGRLDVGDELHELVGLPVEAEPVQGLQGERRVAHPRVAVVPVALAAGGLGERGRRRGHGGAGRHVGEALDHERRALDRVAPAVVGDPRSVEPAAPVAPRRGEHRRRPRRRPAAPRGARPTRARSRQRSPTSSTWRPWIRLPSIPSARSDWRRTAAAARARSRRQCGGCRPTSVQVAASRP